jgi:Sulfotransferase domain
MAEALGRHPSIFMSPKKEPHHFGADLPELRVRTLMRPNDYVELFRGATVETTVAEASVWTMRSALAASEIRSFAPGARIIVMLRDPVDLLASLHGELCRAGVEDILDLQAAIDAEPDRRAGRRIPKGVVNSGQLLYSEAIAFPEQVQRFIDAFGRQAVHVVFFDDIRDDLSPVLSRVERFLGVDPRDDVELVRSNVGRTVKMARLQRFARQQGLTRSVARRLVPAGVRPRVARTVVDTIERVNTSSAGRPPIPADLEIDLRTRYRVEIERLAEMLERDLSGWL